MLVVSPPVALWRPPIRCKRRECDIPMMDLESTKKFCAAPPRASSPIASQHKRMREQETKEIEEEERIKLQSPRTITENDFPTQWTKQMKIEVAEHMNYLLKEQFEKNSKQHEIIMESLWASFAQQIDECYAVSSKRDARFVKEYIS